MEHISAEDWKRIQSNTKGIRVKSIKRLVELLYLHDGSYINFPHISLGFVGYKPEDRVITKLEDAVKLFIEKYKMSKRTAYDYARALEAIQCRFM